MAYLHLYFSQDANNIELFKVIFYDEESAPRVSVRGRNSGAYNRAGAFIWSAGARALSVFFLKAVEQYYSKGSYFGSEFLPIMQGEKGSQASSLLYCIYRHPAWLVKMFGVDGSCDCIIHQIIKVTNRHFSYGNFVHLGIDDLFLSPANIKICLNDKEVTDYPTLEEILLELEDNRNICPEQLSLF